jgi:preprotein translocase subunit YajC
MMILLFGVMWFLLIRPQRKRQQQTASMLSSLQVGDEVMTAGGLYGTITELDIEEVVLEIADGVNVRVDKRAIVNLIEAEEVEEAEEEPARANVTSAS